MRFTLLGLLATVAFAAVGCVALVYPTGLWAVGLLNASLAALFVATLLAIFRSGDSRAWWTGFAVFGWGYLLLLYWNESDVSGGYQSAINQQIVTTRGLRWLYWNAHPRVPDNAPSGMRGGGGIFNVPDETIQALSARRRAQSEQGRGEEHVRVAQFGGGGAAPGGAAGGAPGGGAVAPGGAGGFGGGGAARPGAGGMGGGGAGGAAPMGGPTMPTMPAAPTFPTEEDFLRVGHSLFLLVFAWIGGMLAVVIRRRTLGRQPPADPAAT